VSKSTKAYSIRNRLLSILNNTVVLSLGMNFCAHLEQVNLRAEGKTQGCEECEKIGSDWVHLRLCLSCGHVGCCDSSPNKHGTKHFNSTGHPVIKSYEPGENWKWCFIDEIFMK
jgi:hypothetical protein